MKMLFYILLWHVITICWLNKCILPDVNDNDNLDHSSIDTITGKLNGVVDVSYKGSSF